MAKVGPRIIICVGTLEALLTYSRDPYHLVSDHVQDHLNHSSHN